MKTILKIIPGFSSYSHILNLQKQIVEAKLLDSSLPNILLLLQHKPVYTKGRRELPDPLQETRLKALGADYHHVSCFSRLMFRFLEVAR
jgi:lipoate-protein ligase B